MMTARYTTKQGIRSVCFLESTGDFHAWVALCLEYDICSQADTLPELKERLDMTIEATILVCEERGRQPFEGFLPSPQRYHEMWDRAPA